MDSAERFSFLFLGNNSFRGLPQRDTALAVALARKGFSVVYIEGMPSLAAKVRGLGSRAFSVGSRARAGLANEIPTKIRILTPPTVPTFFRSSWTRRLDKYLFRRWFRREMSGLDWKNVVLVVCLPYWWDGFIEKAFESPMVMYDVFDALEVPSRNRTAFKRMARSHTTLLHDADAVTYSAREMIKGIVADCPSDRKFYLPNAVSREFLESASVSPIGNAQKVIGYIGSLDPRWVDMNLLHRLAENFPDRQFVICASPRRRIRRSLMKHANVKIVPFTQHSELGAMVAGFDVALIPFRQNAITRFVNPLKLYEYCSAGVPIVATRTEELSHYSDLVYLSQTHDEFLANVRLALNETDMKKRAARIEFARANTWETRTDELLRFIRGRVEARKLQQEKDL